MYRPWAGRLFGVELEMNDVDRSLVSIESSQIRAAMASVLPANRLIRAAGGYHRSGGEVWDIKTDGSCGYNHRSGWEIASPKLTMTESGENDELRGVTTALGRLSPRIDRTCGLHVSVNASDFDWWNLRNLIVLWARYEPFVFEMCPPSRRTNHYCAPLRKSLWDNTPHSTWATIERAIEMTTERTFREAAVGSLPRGALNVGHWWQNGRIEFRLGAGTINYEKIIRFSQFLISFVTRVKNDRMPVIQSGWYSDRGFSTLYVFKMLGLAPSKFVPAEEIPPESRRLMEWVEARRRGFASQPVPTANRSPNAASEPGESLTSPGDRTPARRDDLLPDAVAEALRRARTGR